MSDDEKTEEPTGKKLNDAKKKGQFAKSKDFPQCLVLILGMWGLLTFGDSMGRSTQEYALTMFQFAGERVTDPHKMLTDMFFYSVYFLWQLLALPLAMLWLFTVVLSFAQQRFILPEDSLKFNLEKLNPITGFKEKFLSLQPIVELVKSLLKLGLLGYITFQIILSEWDGLPSMIYAPPKGILIKVQNVVNEIFWSCFPIIVLILILDFAYQWYDNRKQLKMSKQEIKDEHKQQEGDARLKAEQKTKRKEMVISAIIQNLEKADVVVVNPTHFSVALRYRKEEADAPVVVAKGVDFLALRLRTLANQKDIPIIENPPLARGLYFQTTIGQEIPPDFYAAVAEVLALIYRRRQARQAPV